MLESRDKIGATMVSPDAVHTLTAAAKAGDMTAHLMLAEVHRVILAVREQRSQARCALCETAISAAHCVANFAMVHAAVAQPNHLIGLLICQQCHEQLRTRLAVENSLRGRYRDVLGLELDRVQWIGVGAEAAAAVA